MAVAIFMVLVVLAVAVQVVDIIQQLRQLLEQIAEAIADTAAICTLRESGSPERPPLLEVDLAETLLWEPAEETGYRNLMKWSPRMFGLARNTLSTGARRPGSAHTHRTATRLSSQAGGSSVGAWSPRANAS